MTCDLSMFMSFGCDVSASATSGLPFDGLAVHFVRSHRIQHVVVFSPFTTRVEPMLFCALCLTARSVFAVCSAHAIQSLLRPRSTGDHYSALHIASQSTFDSPFFSTLPLLVRTRLLLSVLRCHALQPMFSSTLLITCLSNVKIFINSSDKEPSQ